MIKQRGDIYVSPLHRFLHLFRFSKTFAFITALPKTASKCPLKLRNSTIIRGVYHYFTTFLSSGMEEEQQKQSRGSSENASFGTAFLFAILSKTCVLGR